MAESLAAELDIARRELEAIAVGLCSDVVVFGRHPEPLQRFDQIGQVMGEVSSLLRSSGPPEHRLASVRLEAMRERLSSRTDLWMET